MLKKDHTSVICFSLPLSVFIAVDFLGHFLAQTFKMIYKKKNPFILVTIVQLLNGAI